MNRAQKLITAVRSAEEAQEIVDKARADAVQAIVDAMPLLTTEQREELRPILAGTIPAEAARVDGAA